MPGNGDEKQDASGVSRSDPTGALPITHLVRRCSEAAKVEIGFLDLNGLDAVLSDMVRISIFKVPVKQNAPPFMELL
jgi:hypothetical protein